MFQDKVVFKTFRQLDQHIRREHEKYYCDLCVTNLRVFTHERKFYNRKDLVEHRRKGDPDDTSFKGEILINSISVSAMRAFNPS